MLLSIQGGSNLGLNEIYEASSLVQDAVHPEANIIFGTVIDDTLGDEVRVTVIAAGFDSIEPATPANPELIKRRTYVTPAETPEVNEAESASEFGEAIVSPPVEAVLADPSFMDDDDIDIPDFLK